MKDEQETKYGFPKSSAYARTRSSVSYTEYFFQNSTPRTNAQDSNFPHGHCTIFVPGRPPKGATFEFSSLAQLLSGYLSYKDGSLLASHLLEHFEKGMPKASAAKVQKEFQLQLGAYEHVEDAKLRMLARLLSYNSELISSDYALEQQSHWNGISKELAEQTRISFFAPCLRMRWR